jgi:hypothetical protein
MFIRACHEVCGDLATFFLVMALGELCSPASKTYSSVPLSLAAPRYRNSSGRADHPNRRLRRGQSHYLESGTRVSFQTNSFINEWPFGLGNVSHFMIEDLPKLPSFF